MDLFESARCAKKIPGLRKSYQPGYPPPWKVPGLKRRENLQGSWCMVYLCMYACRNRFAFICILFLFLNVYIYILIFCDVYSYVYMEFIENWCWLFGYSCLPEQIYRWM